MGADVMTTWRQLIARFFRLGWTGFGGPPAHVAQMRRQWVDGGDVDAQEFSDAFGAVSILPGPASTQLALWLGWRAKRLPGMFVAGLLFISPSVALATMLATHLRGRSALAHVVEWFALGASAVVPAIAWWSAINIVKVPFRSGVSEIPRSHYRCLCAVGFVGGLASAMVNPVITLLATALGYLAFRRVTLRGSLAAGIATNSPLSGIWVMALKVGALSFGGGFVIVPMMRADVIHQHWMTSSLFASAVALGQVTPGPVVATVAAIGVLRGGVTTGLLAAAIAFAPSFLFIGTLSPHLSRLRASASGRLVTGALGAAAAGMIGASGVLLAAAERQWWLGIVTALACVAGKRIPFLALLAAGGVIGLVIH